MSGFIVVLDPDEVSVNRTALDLNSGAIRVLQDGIDWGDDAITAYEADSKTGSVMVDYRKPNRIISIPLVVGADDNGVEGFTSANKALRAKVGLMERQGGWIKRDSGNGKMYADIVTATLTFPDHWGEKGIEPDVVLKLEALPDFYGDEVALPAVSSTNGILSAVVTNGSSANLITDPSFEYDTIGSAPADWGDNSTGGTLVVTEAWADDGTHALDYQYTNPDGTTTYPGLAIDVGGTTPGATHYMRVSYEEVENTTTSIPSLAVSWSDSEGNFISHAAFNSVTRADGVCSGFVTAPAGAVNAEFQFFYSSYTKGAALHVYVDAVLVVASTLAASYVDGDTAGYQWSGAPGNSATIVDTVIAGDYPARCRIVVSETAGSDQHGLVYGLRSRHYDSADTAALIYEAEALSPINGSTVVSDASYSGGEAVSFTVPTGGGDTWAPMLLSSLPDGTPLTHQGNYRVLARAEANPQVSLRLAWSVGTLAVPILNDPVAVATGGFWLLDLGIVRLDSQPVGSNAWYGVVQAYGAEAANVSVDQLILVPLDDSAGQMVYYPSASNSSPTVNQSAGEPTVFADDAGANGVGTAAWTTGTEDGTPLAGLQSTGGVNGTSHDLLCTGLGLAVPDGATILGIVVQIQNTVWSGSATDHSVVLLKAGVPVGTDQSAHAAYTSNANQAETNVYGSATDLWGTTWTPADLNATDFGIALSVDFTTDASGNFQLYIAPSAVTIYYQLESGFAIPDDAVLYANRTAELRTEGMYRTYDGTVYGPISTVLGDLPRLPPSGAEGRACELLIRPSVGDFDSELDSALGSFTAQVFYRPSYLFRP